MPAFVRLFSMKKVRNYCQKFRFTQLLIDRRLYISDKPFWEMKIPYKIFQYPNQHNDRYTSSMNWYSWDINLDILTHKIHKKYTTTCFHGTSKLILFVVLFQTSSLILQSRIMGFRIRFDRCFNSTLLLFLVVIFIDESLD